MGDVVLLGDAATEAGFSRALAAHPGRWRSVHFACHGLVDAERPFLSALALTPGDGDDGFLTALDVLGLSLPADLVVLSACESGRGRVVRGEGLVGLVGAFLHAGASRVVASLWNVGDAPAKAFMTRFYALARSEDRGIAAALAETAATMRAEGAPARTGPPGSSGVCRTDRRPVARPRRRSGPACAPSHPERQPE